jgi:hypothetical protein
MGRELYFGDPCGSKYNNDPFEDVNAANDDATRVQKPGLPDDMKARIQALVDENKQQY